jgi:hypothetical protein
MVLKDWAIKYNINYPTLRQRIIKYNYPFEKAVLKKDYIFKIN